MEKQYTDNLETREQNIAALHKQIEEKDQEIKVNYECKCINNILICFFLINRNCMKMIVRKKQESLNYNRSRVNLNNMREEITQEHQLLQMSHYN
jgi:hypothetical protein